MKLKDAILTTETVNGQNRLFTTLTKARKAHYITRYELPSVPSPRVVKGIRFERVKLEG